MCLTGSHDPNFVTTTGTFSGLVPGGLPLSNFTGRWDTRGGATGVGGLLMAVTTGGKPSTPFFSSRRFLWRTVSHTLSVYYYRASTEDDGSGVQDPSVEEGNRSVMGGVSVCDTDIEVGHIMTAADGLKLLSVEPSGRSSQVRFASAPQETLQGPPPPVEQKTQTRKGNVVVHNVGGNPMSSQSVFRQEFVLFGSPPCQFWVQVLVPFPVSVQGSSFALIPSSVNGLSPALTPYLSYKDYASCWLSS